MVKSLKKRKVPAETRDDSELMWTLRIWTRDLQIFSLTLSQLSYLGNWQLNYRNVNKTVNKFRILAVTYWLERAKCYRHIERWHFRHCLPHFCFIIIFRSFLRKVIEGAFECKLVFLLKLYTCVWNLKDLLIEFVKFAIIEATKGGTSSLKRFLEKISWYRPRYQEIERQVKNLKRHYVTMVTPKSTKHGS